VVESNHAETCDLFCSTGYSLKSVPFGTAYALWTGIGAAGSMIAGMLVFGESADAFRIGCLTLIIAGMIGLKLAS
jgi:quaternary ammonium compound-resistance protein SugE